MLHRLETNFGGRPISIETGKLAKQAGGSVIVRYGDTIVLVTATASKKPKEGADFLPLTVDYVEKTFAAGKIPGGFFKREGRPSERETLTSRFIDRPIRPLFPDGYCNETQVIATVLSADLDNEPDILAMTGASTALMLSDAPFLGPIAGVCVGRVEGQWIINPTPQQMNESDIDLIVAGSESAVVMVEGGADELSEEEMVEAIRVAHEAIQPILKLQKELVKLAGKPKMEVTPPKVDETLNKKVTELLKGKLLKAVTIQSKQERQTAIKTLEEESVTKLIPEGTDEEEAEDLKGEIAHFFEEELRKVVRQMILKEKRRIDGRGTQDIRPISCETGLLPRVHGSALFTRGETQALVSTTLGTTEDKQLIDALGESYYKHFMLHYNFPPYSTGEVKFLRSPGRREIGHGALAERSLQPMIPAEENFPYTIRVVAETLSSNGSSTALQMDIKIAGLSEKLLTEALAQAREGRMHILGIMEKTLATPRPEISQYAPKITTLKINREKIGALIGPGGKMIRSIIEETGATIDVEDDGTVKVFATDQASGDAAIKKIKAVTASPEIGRYYKGPVVKIMEFGAFVEIMPGCDGLVHISQLDNSRVKQVTDVVKEGDEIVVKVLEVDPKSGKIRLSRKEAIGHEAEVEM